MYSNRDHLDIPRYTGYRYNSLQTDAITNSIVRTRIFVQVVHTTLTLRISIYTPKLRSRFCLHLVHRASFAAVSRSIKIDIQVWQKAQPPKQQRPIDAPKPYFFWLGGLCTMNPPLKSSAEIPVIGSTFDSCEGVSKYCTVSADSGLNGTADHRV